MRICIYPSSILTLFFMFWSSEAIKSSLYFAVMGGEDTMPKFESFPTDTLKFWWDNTQTWYGGLLVNIERHTFLGDILNDFHLINVFVDYHTFLDLVALKIACTGV